MVGSIKNDPDTPRLELYHIAEDAGEEKNLIAEHPGRAQAMLAAYDDWWDAVRPLMINEDAPLDVEKQYLGNYEKQKADSGIPTWAPPEL